MSPETLGAAAAVWRRNIYTGVIPKRKMERDRDVENKKGNFLIKPDRYFICHPFHEIQQFKISIPGYYY